MEVRSRTALPNILVMALGVILVVSGVLVPLWTFSLSMETAQQGARLFSDGPLRPVMITLPEPVPGKGTIAISETEVSQGQFYRVMRVVGFPPGVLSFDGSWSACPAPIVVDWVAPITCIGQNYAKEYAVQLTAIENRVRKKAERGLLTQCYQFKGSGFERIKDSCSGYRLPTEAEVRHALTVGERYALDLEVMAAEESVCEEGERPEACAAEPVSHVKSGQLNDWYLFNLAGNADEFVEASGRGSTILSVLSDKDLRVSDSSSTLSFRIIRDVAQ